MSDELDLLRRVADLARYVRQLERGLVTAQDALLTVERLRGARAQLDEALAKLETLEKD